MGKYINRKAVDAHLFTGEVDPVIEWKMSFPGYDAYKQPMSPFCGHGLSIGRGEEEIIATRGDYVVRSYDGVYSVMSADEFNDTYVAIAPPFCKPTPMGFSIRLIVTGPSSL